ncbi:MAG: hypothetical protein MK291_09880 [Planctomycetes bacterium]|nr:hypothetical protein [Planctomycetota bacterium]
MSPSEIPGDFDDLEPILDGSDLEPLLDGGGLEPIEEDIPVHIPEAESTLDVPEQPEAPAVAEPEPMDEPEPEPAPEPEPEAVLVEEEPPAEEATSQDEAVAAAAVGAAAIAGDAAAESAASEAGDGAASARGKKPQGKRELEKAPLIQLKAAQFLMIVCFLPWADPTVNWLSVEVEKLICALGVFLGVQAQLAYGGEKALGFMKGLTKGGARNGVLLGFVVSLVGLAPITAEFATGPLLEKLTLIGAGFTYAHIVGYRLGGGFNPLYSFAFTLPVFGGVPALMNGLASDAGGFAKILGLFGALGATWFGVQGVRALIIAMKEAKAEGEAKKKAAIEARRAARKAGKKVAPMASRKPRK